MRYYIPLPIIVLICNYIMVIAGDTRGEEVKQEKGRKGGECYATCKVGKEGICAD